MPRRNKRDTWPLFKKFLFSIQVNVCKTEPAPWRGSRSPVLSSQGMARVEDGHAEDYDRCHLLTLFWLSFYWHNGAENGCVFLYRSSVMLEDGQDGMDSSSLTPGLARQVCIQRHPSHGFGFIAGSERPVVVRSVSAGRTSVLSEAFSQTSVVHLVKHQMW